MKQNAKLLDCWLPPDGAGAPVAVLATTFTFDPDFFEEECLGRFVGLDGKRGEGDRMADTASVIDREERLAEVRAAVLVDRSYGEEGRSLRWDVLPVHVPGGLLHAKVALLVWERLVRVIVSSANLTTQGCREQLETAAVFDAHDGSEVPSSVFEGVIAALREIAGRAPGAATSPPKARALSTLDTALRRVRSFELPESFPERLLCEIALVRPGASAFEALRRVWSGRTQPREATVVSPFFDTNEERSAAALALVGELAKSGKRSVSFVVPVDRPSQRPAIVRAPRAIRAAVPPGVDLSIQAYQTPEKEEPRWLHGKFVALHSLDWTAALVGSSNFTRAGLGLSPAGHLEVNVVIGAPAGSPMAAALAELFDRYAGDPVDLEAVDWYPQQEDETASHPPVPLGFAECLFDPGGPSRFILFFDGTELPPTWWLRLPDGRSLLDATGWREAGSPAEMTLPGPGLAEVYMLSVHWEQDGVEYSAAWAANVTEPARLPPPQQLHNLSARALLLALASTRPVHEALAREIEREARAGRAGADELDPLRRYSGVGQLMARVRSYSQGLAGLRRRLQRPFFSLDSLRWRLEGALGPVTIARKWTEDHEGGRALTGETDFLLAELVRTLRGVDWRSAARGVSRADVDRLVGRSIEEIRSLRRNDSEDARLRSYVERVLDVEVTA